MLNKEIIYDAPKSEFFRDVLVGKFADKLRENFLNAYGRSVGKSEYDSWIAAGNVIRNLIDLSSLNNLYVSFEYQVPYTQKRIDCLLFGRSKQGKGMMIHIELKQWQKVEALPVEGNFVETYTGGDTRKVVHPSQQVQG